MKNILIVEDDKEMQEIYRNYFWGMEEKYRIEMESSAEVALKRSKEKTYDLIILDIIMGPMTGDSFFVYVRQDTKTMNTPILVVSVLREEILVNLKKLSHVSFLEKPIGKDELLKKIEEVLGGESKA